MSSPPFALTTFPGGRRLLLAGFGALLILMLAAGVDALLVLRKVRASDAQVRDAYFTRSRSLEGVRAGIYESAIVMRDFSFPARSASPAQLQEQEWTSMRERTDTALSASAAALNDQEQPRVRNLQTQLAAYWKLMDLAAETNRWDPDAWSSTYFSGEMLRRRNAMIDLIDQIDQLSARDLAASDASLNATFDGLRVRLIVMLVATFGVGMFVAGFTIARTLRLETELQQRYVELQELSARLLSAQEEERRAISRELHDEVGQSLSALLMEAGNAAATGGSQEIRKHVESIKKLAEASVAVIRNMTLLLRPSMLDDFGLVPALEWQAREVSKRTGMRVQVSAEESAGELSDELKTCIYRVVQEALHNCARHAHARAVKVVVRQEPFKIILSVEDDGQGFDARRRVRGLGLVGMEERVNHLGGAFEIESRPGAGTRVAVELPLAS